MDSVEMKPSSPPLSERGTKNEFESSDLWLETEQKSFVNRPTFHSSTVNGGLRSNTVITASSGPTANVCKVRPQKQPQPTTTSTVLVCSPTPLLPQTTVTKTFMSATVPVSSGQLDSDNLVSTSDTRLSHNYASLSSNPRVSSSSGAYTNFPQQLRINESPQPSSKAPLTYDASTTDMTQVAWPLLSKNCVANQMLNQPLPGSSVLLNMNSFSSDQMLSGKNCSISESESINTHPALYLPRVIEHSTFRHTVGPMSVGQQSQDSLIGPSINDLQVSIMENSFSSF